MDTLDIIGWVASAFVILSFLINDMLRLRFVNLVGASLWLAYGVVDLSSSIIFLNIVIVSIQIFKIYHLYRTKKV
tara:strand:- start:127 stop:351 length:225 start_codon:yes stop_codon:yes gene_type:complete